MLINRSGILPNSPVSSTEFNHNAGDLGFPSDLAKMIFNFIWEGSQKKCDQGVKPGGLPSPGIERRSPREGDSPQRRRHRVGRRAAMRAVGEGKWE